MKNQKTKSEKELSGDLKDFKTLEVEQAIKPIQTLQAMTDSKIIRHIYSVKTVVGDDTFYRLESANSDSILTDLICIDYNERPVPHGMLDSRVLFYQSDLLLWCCELEDSDQYDLVAHINKAVYSNVFYGLRRQKSQSSLIVFKFDHTKELLVIDYYDGYRPSKPELDLILEKYK